MELLASITAPPAFPQATTKPLLNHVSVNMPHLAVYAHTSPGLGTHFLQECVGALPVLFSLPASQLLTRRMWRICSGCVLSVVTPLEFLFQSSFEPEEALMAAAAAAARESWKQLQNVRGKEQEKAFLASFFFKIRPPPPSNPRDAPSSTQPRHPLPSIHTSKDLLRSQEHV